MPKTYSSKDELIKDANLFKDSVNDVKMAHTVYLYFIARYLIVSVEARYNKSTTQSWKEIRDAFDHYMRAQTQGPTDTTNHHKKIEGHVQRAILDTCKILCREVHDSYKGVFSRYDRSAINLVDNGDFIRGLQTQTENAEKIFLCAKTEDANLGDDANNNVEVLNKFLDAFFAYEKLLVDLRAKDGTITAIEKSLSYLEKIKNKITPLAFLKVGIMALIAWFLWSVADIWFEEAIKPEILPIIKSVWTELLLKFGLS